ncbi:MAG: peptidoglycan-binding protein [Candidatus Omnitrophica bacterium]|nr:peptidoglycan-binding protein [Candidatus Omnitrophota bacterium]
MKKLGLISLVVLAVSLAGCGKKEAALDEMQEPVSMESLGAVTTGPTATTAVSSTPVTPAVVSAPSAPAALEPLPPAGPYKPTANEIQTALKNAGYYTGEIDGKLGPKSKAAVEEFQKANNLKADGKVGPMTWEALGKYLNPAPVTPSKKR